MIYPYKGDVISTRKPICIYHLQAIYQERRKTMDNETVGIICG